MDLTGLDLMPLVIGIGGSAAVIGGAIALGIRHGIDWDHIAAITDITSTTASIDDPEEAWLVEEPGVMLTDESHHSLGADPRSAGAIAAAQRLLRIRDPLPVGGGSGGARAAAPAGRDAPKGAPHSWPLPRFLVRQRRAILLGTIYALGHGTVVTILGIIAILASGLLPEWIDPLMERVVGITLILLGVYLLYAIYRFFRGGEEFRMRSRWMLVFAGIRNAFRWVRARLTGAHHHEHVPAADQYGVKTAYTVGMIHGIGAETGTQVLIIATAVGAGTKAMGIAALLGFVVGLLISNSFVTVTSTVGFISARRRQSIYVAAGALAACFSLAIGAIFLLQAGDILPDLGRYFRWIGGPEG